MDQHVKALWVAALRSGKYTQGTGALCINDTYCCLGVLCDLAVQEEIILCRESSHLTGHIGFGFPHDLNYSLLPYKVYAWANLPGNDPKIEIDGTTMSLSELNDAGKSFEEIATLIEEQL